MTIRLRPSAILKYQMCPYAYHLQYEQGLEMEVKSANLYFGTAVHNAITSWIRDDALGTGDRLPVERFEEAWGLVLSSVSMTFSTSFTPDEMTDMGKVLTDKFPESWRKLDLIPLFDAKGALIERRFEAPISEGVILTGQPDFVGMNTHDEVIVLDFKTAASPSSIELVTQSDQLSAYQFIIESHKSNLGIDHVHRLGFMDLLKKKVPKRHGEGPVVMTPNSSHRRDNATLLEFRDKVTWIAEDIQRKRFPKTPLMAFNTPCDMCDFKNLCAFGDPDGLDKTNRNDTSE